MEDLHSALVNWPAVLGALGAFSLFVMGAFQALSFWVLNKVWGGVEDVKKEVKEGLTGEAAKREELDRCVQKMKRQVAVIEERCVFRHRRDGDPNGADFRHHRTNEGTREE